MSRDLLHQSINETPVRPLEPGLALRRLRGDVCQQRCYCWSLTRSAPSGFQCAANLTPQETRLLKLLAQGYSYNRAAGQLKISVNTVRDHIRSIYDKLHVHSKSEAVSKALRNRLIS